MEPPLVVAGWARKAGFAFPVLLDADGSVAESYAPAGVLPDLPRNQVVIASNLLIDRAGRIQFFSLLDSANFDARLVALRAKLDELLGDPGRESARASLTLAPSAPLPLKPGGRAQARIDVTVEEGFYVQANPASEPHLVPLRLDLRGDAAIDVGRAVYPPGRRHRLRGAASDLSVYEGSFAVKVPVAASPTAEAGEFLLRGALHYQACNDRLCLRPAMVPVELLVRVGSGP